MKSNNKITGNDGENIAAEFLSSLGYSIIEKNYRFHKGELDIIAFDNKSNYLVFVEVKTRTNMEYGDPVFALTASKRKQLEWLGTCYLTEKNLKDRDCRFDAITISKQPGENPIINHYINILN